VPTQPTVNLSFQLSSTASLHEIIVIVKLDDSEIVRWHADTVPLAVDHQFEDVESEHCLQIVMEGKTANHTTVDPDGAVIKDVLIKLDNISFDGIDIRPLMWTNSVYHHDFNGTGKPTSEDFFGTMGCNGRVELRFTTPVYVWLLENM